MNYMRITLLLPKNFVFFYHYRTRKYHEKKTPRINLSALRFKFHIPHDKQESLQLPSLADQKTNKD